MLEAIRASSSRLFIELINNDKTGGEAKLEAETDNEVLVVNIRIDLSTKGLDEE